MEKYDFEITERRELLQSFFVMIWLSVPLYYLFGYLGRLTDEEFQNHVQVVSSYIPEGLEILLLLWPWYLALIGIFLTVVLLRVGFRLRYGKWL